MNTNLLIPVLAIVCGVGGGFLGARLAGPCTASAADDAAVAPAPQHGAAIAALEQRTASIERRLENLQMGLADVAAANRSAVARAAEPAPVPAPAATTKAEKGVSNAVQSAIDRILAGDVEWEESQRLWKEIADAGKLDEVVQMLEERAKARGNDPDAQVESGLAYLQKVFRAGGGPEAGVWATKADKAFDAALALDDNHWMARFQKAVSLSFWPPVMGMQPDSVKHFEILVAQQENATPHEGFVHTYLMLGNLHLQMGAKDKAIATWQKGLAKFPDNEELKKKLSDVQH
jgi:tetratricopeptide (TPR) repeat protein